MEDQAVTTNAEEYMEGIYRLSRGGAEVTASDLARHMGISMASVTGMLKRLAERGLVTYAPYKEIKLTGRGEEIALSLIRRHRLSERLLTDILGMPWDKAHDEACKFEHVISGEVEKRLEEALGNPTTCPHGHPLDDRAHLPTVPLSSLNPQEKAVIVKIEDERSEFLQYLATLGLMPGVAVEVTGRAPFNGPLMVQVGNASYALGREVAEKIAVQRGEQ